MLDFINFNRILYKIITNNYSNVNMLFRIILKFNPSNLLSIFILKLNFTFKSVPSCYTLVQLWLVKQTTIINSVSLGIDGVDVNLILKLRRRCHHPHTWCGLSPGKLRGYRELRAHEFNWVHQEECSWWRRACERGLNCMLENNSTVKTFTRPPEGDSLTGYKMSGKAGYKISG